MIQRDPTWSNLIRRDLCDLFLIFWWSRSVDIPLPPPHPQEKVATYSTIIQVVLSRATKFVARGRFRLLQRMRMGHSSLVLYSTQAGLWGLARMPLLSVLDGASCCMRDQNQRYNIANSKPTRRSFLLRACRHPSTVSPWIPWDWSVVHSDTADRGSLTPLASHYGRAPGRSWHCPRQLQWKRVEERKLIEFEGFNRQVPHALDVDTTAISLNEINRPCHGSCTGTWLITFKHVPGKRTNSSPLSLSHEWAVISFAFRDSIEKSVFTDWSPTVSRFWEKRCISMHELTPHHITWRPTGYNSLRLRSPTTRQTVMLWDGSLCRAVRKSFKKDSHGFRISRLSARRCWLSTW